MKKEELISNIAKVLGASEKETTLAFDIFLQKVSETLELDESLRVPGLGIFQLNRRTKNALEQGVDDRSLSINFIPLSTSTKPSAPEIISFPVSRKLNDSGFDESVFSLSIDKPLIPVSGRQKQEYLVQSSYLMLQREIEDKVEGLIEEATRMNDFRLNLPVAGGDIVLPEDALDFSMAKSNPDDVEIAEVPWDFSEEENQSEYLESPEEYETDITPGLYQDEIDGEDEPVQFEQETDELDEKLDLLVGMDTNDSSLDIGLDELNDESFMDEELDFSQILENETLNLEEDDYAPEDFQSREVLESEDTGTLNAETMDNFTMEAEILVEEYEEEETSEVEIPENDDTIDDGIMEEPQQVEEPADLPFDTEEESAEVIADEPVLEETNADTAGVDEITTEENNSTDITHSMPVAGDIGLLEPGESRKKDGGSPVFWLILACFLLVTVAGAYYFLFMSKKTNHSSAATAKTETNDKNFSAAYEVTTEIIERNDEIPVTPEIEASEEAEQQQGAGGEGKNAGAEDKSAAAAASKTAGKDGQSKADDKKAADNNIADNKVPENKITESNVPEKKAAEVKKPEVKKPETNKVSVPVKTGNKQNIAAMPGNLPVENAARYIRSDTKDKMVRPYIFSDGNRFTIQKSSWQNGSKAAAEVIKYRRLGYDSYIVKYSPKNEIPWYRVRIGDYGTVTDAETVLKRLP